MAPPTPLSVATNSINRLLKEESSYRTELATQQRRVEELQAGGADEDDAGNTEFRLRQEKRAVEETKAVFGPLRERIAGAVEKLEGVLASGKAAGGMEVDAANDALVRAKATS
ncbi:hypothetical protein HO133_008010 [Letharia lupina]|uniref:Tubulin-specific chaperone A n=1 Tax=Letharia lupina TaxID=560253 RepID=A0A8H6CRD5_9LECA|nr:uncharacterized protein HO133_008010 [Letharia lupina]KAF6228280.1 hypothetical protein HO133_008010 [Letharia lupina]